MTCSIELAVIVFFLDTKGASDLETYLENLETSQKTFGQTRLLSRLGGKTKIQFFTISSWSIGMQKIHTHF